MEEITLEKIDIIKERTGVSYTDAKEALENSEGNVVDALIYIEAKETKSAKFNMDEMYTTKDEFLAWIKDIARKGNVTRIKIKKDEKVVIDIPVNAGIAVGLIGLCIPYLFGIGLFAAVVTKVTIEITKADGSVEVINTIIKNTVDDVVSKMSDMGEDVKEKYNETKDNFTKGNKDDKETKDSSTDNVYQYTVKFEEKDKEEDKKEDIKNENTKEEE